MPVELTGEPAEEGHRHEYRNQYQGDRNHRACDFAHRSLGGLARVEFAALHDLGYRLHHHDGIVHYQSDGEHQGESVRVLMENPSARKALKVPISDTGTASIGMSVARQFSRKMKTTKQHQHTRLDERLDHLAHGFGYEQCGVEGYGIVDARRKGGRRAPP